MNTTKTENEQSQKEPNQTTFGSFTLFVGIGPMVFPTVIDILGIPVGDLTEGLIMVSIYTIGGIISWWHWRRLRATIGWLLFALALGLLIIVGVKNNPLAIVAFFGSILSGTGLIISEGFAEVENRTAS